MQRPNAFLASLAAGAALVACSVAPTGPATLYARLGGAAQVTPVVDRLIDRAASDSRTRRSFDGVKLASVKQSIVEQICSIASGGCRYEGESMERAHRDARISASEFDALVTMLREELDRAAIDTGAKNELLRLLAPMKRDIVSNVNNVNNASGVNGAGKSERSR